MLLLFPTMVRVKPVSYTHLAAKRIAREEPKANIVVIAPDGVEKYLSLLDFANNEYVK